MSTEQALLAAVWDRPHDDVPRLVYADWLDENGQPERAEFIRVQCELATLDEWDDRRPALEWRQDQLWKRHAKAWKAGLPKVLRAAGFSRGFPAPRLRAVTADRFIKLPADEFVGAPLWHFHLHPNVRKAAELFGNPNLLRVGILDFRFWFESVDVVQRFVESPNVGNLGELNVGWNRGLAGAGAVVLAGATLPALRSLDLGYDGLTDRCAAALAEGSLVRGVRRLSLESNEITPAGFAELIRSPRVSNLKALNLHSARLADRGMGTLADAAPTFRPVELDLRYNVIRDAGAEALAAWPGLAEVRRLLLSSNPIDDAGLDALTRSPYLTGLRELELWSIPAGWQAKDRARERFGDAVRFLPPSVTG